MSDKHLTSGEILVTGASGFIGSALIAYLNHLGHDNILACDILSHDEKFKNLIPLRFNDYIEYEDFSKLLLSNSDRLKNISCIFHLGGCSATTETDCSYLIKNNYEFTKDLAEFSVKKNIRFVYASSAATYGDGEAGMLDDESLLHTLRPLNMYGYSKHLFDLYAKRNNFLNKIYGMKYFNVFGPNEYHKGSMKSMVVKAFEQITNTGKVKLFKSYKKEFTDGGQVRDFFYIKDAIKMTVHLAKTEHTGGLFNLGSGRASTWIELITPVFESLNKEVKIEFVDMPEEIREKYQYFTLADISKIRKSGYSGEITELSASVKDYVTNYLIDNKTLDASSFK